MGCRKLDRRPRESGGRPQMLSRCPDVRLRRSRHLWAKRATMALIVSWSCARLIATNQRHRFSAWSSGRIGNRARSVGADRGPVDGSSGRAATIPCAGVPPGTRGPGVVDRYEVHGVVPFRLQCHDAVVAVAAERRDPAYAPGRRVGRIPSNAKPRAPSDTTPGIDSARASASPTLQPCSAIIAVPDPNAEDDADGGRVGEGEGEHHHAGTIKLSFDVISRATSRPERRWCCGARAKRRLAHLDAVSRRCERRRSRGL